jgi:hypothetical protein
MAILFYRKKNARKAAEKLVGGRIVKSVPNISLTDLTSVLLKGEAHKLDLSTTTALEKEYRENPVLSSVINIKADYASNARINVRNIKTGEVFTEKDFRENKNLDKIVQKMFRLKNNPNPLQSTKEFLALSSIFKDVFGNGFIYGNSPMGIISIQDVDYLWHVWPQFMKPKVTGKFFDQIGLEGIIEKWLWENGDYKRVFSINEVLHRKEPNIRLNKKEDVVLGESRQVSLAWALANIKIAYESRNIIAKERGPRAIISSNSKDDFASSLPMEEEDKKEVQGDFQSKYGTMDGQDQFMVTRHNIAVHTIDQDVRKLGLLNEISSDAQVVCNRYGVPYNLLKMDLKGTTYENQIHDERRMYQNEIIPEEADRWNDINNWLRCRDFGFEYIVDFTHLPAMQENFKEKSEIDKNINTIQKELFFAGVITYNQWLAALGMPQVSDTWGNQRIVDMLTEQIQKIKGNFSINDSLDKVNEQ